ncbi:rRNA methyltransferase 1, mitochondrial [Monosporozyma unispora]
MSLSLKSNYVIPLLLIKRYASSSSYAKKPSPSFDKTFNGVVNRRTKAWEKDGSMDKDTWFKKKYAHIHIKQKQKDAHLQQVKDSYHTQKLERLSHKQKYNTTKQTLLKHNSSSFLEHIYGTNCVIAALLNKNRTQFYRLLYSSESVLKENDQLSQLIEERKIRTVLTTKHDLNLLTRNGVHNGIVLESKPLDPVEITHLGPVNIEVSTFQINKFQSEFDSHDEIPVLKQDYLLKNDTNKLYPLGVYLDEVSDAHNLGAILRTCFYLGVDFIVISRKNCAQLSPVVNKCSSGAMEYIPIYMVDKPLTFFDKSQEQGQWIFITSHIDKNANNTRRHTVPKLSPADMSSILEHNPVMLVVGNEGAGVRTNLQMKSDFTVQIPYGGPEGLQGSIDSLNVSVATAILLSNLLSSSSASNASS